MLITYIHDHDEPGFVLTAYYDGEPVAWIAETPGCWELHTGYSIHAYPTFKELQKALENDYR